MKALSGIRSVFLFGTALSLVFVLNQSPGFCRETEEFEMEEMVVTGTKTERLLIDVPVRTEVITAKDIEAKGAVNLYEALEGMPGIRVEQQCSFCNFSVVRMQGLESGHVQVLIDGQPLYSGLAGVYGLQQIPASNIERIEVVKGAGSALYGSSAIAGTINIITKRPAKKPEVRVSTSFGEYGTNVYTVDASGRKDDMDIMVTAQRNVGDEVDENSDMLTDRVKTENTTGGVRLGFYELIGDDQLTISARVTDETRKGGDLTDGAWLNPFAASSEHITTERNEINIGYKKKFAYDNEIGISFAYCHHDRDATNDTFLGDYESCFGSAPLVTDMEPYTAGEDLYVLDINYAHPVAERHRLLGGIQYLKNELEETGKYIVVDDTAAGYGTAAYAGDPAYRSESEKSCDEYGLYLQDEISLRDNLELVIGARYDTHESKDSFAGSGGVTNVQLTYEEESFNPRAALMYRPFDELTLRTSVGTGFRVPYGFSEDLHLCSGSPRVYKGSGLKPEESVSLNFGADYVVEKYSVSANIFRTNLKDKIGFADASAASTALGYDYEWQNLGDAYTQGMELGSKIALLGNLDLDLSLTYTNAEYKDKRSDWVNHGAHGNKFADDSRYISRVPEFTGGIGLNYIPEQDWNLVLDCDYTGEMYIDYCKAGDVTDPASEIVHTSDFWVVNLRAAKDNLFKEGLTGFIGVKNVFDEVQKDKRTDDAAFMYKPYIGRMVYAGMSVEF
ncbi:MAG: TonB-dependent receptor [Candidatus Omnitrophica bacterium]|nr:TonB-dependent receptor [Candidatus Omnitrophota bacterium]